MQILITHSSMKATRALHFARWQLCLAATGIVLVVAMLAGGLYHVLLLKGASEGWPVFNQLVQLTGRDEVAQRDRYLRENLDVMARKVGEMQAKLIQLEARGERVSGLAGVKPQDLKQFLKPADAAGGGKGGPYVPIALSPEVSSLAQLDQLVQGLEGRADQSTDILTLVESRLLEKRLAALMVPNSRPVDGVIGSGFGFRSDPFSGRAALHTGLDFQSDTGAEIHASAGGVVQLVEQHPQYGLMVEIEHGRGLVTRYAHTSKVLVKAGDLVKRGQLIGLVGTSGRSTGPHLHFEVLVEGVQQDPAKFLAAGEATGISTATLVGARR